MSLVFDEYGRPFILVRDQERKTRKKGAVCFCLLPAQSKPILLTPCHTYSYCYKLVCLLAFLRAFYQVETGAERPKVSMTELIILTASGHCRYRGSEVKYQCSQDCCEGNELSLYLCHPCIMLPVRAALLTALAAANRHTKDSM
jgi:hypothetical protein